MANGSFVPNWKMNYGKYNRENIFKPRRKFKPPIDKPYEWYKPLTNKYGNNIWLKEPIWLEQREVWIGFWTIDTKTGTQAKAGYYLLDDDYNLIFENVEYDYAVQENGNALRRQIDLTYMESAISQDGRIVLYGWDGISNIVSILQLWNPNIEPFAPIQNLQVIKRENLPTVIKTTNGQNLNFASGAYKGEMNKIDVDWENNKMAFSGVNWDDNKIMFVTGNLATATDKPTEWSGQTSTFNDKWGRDTLQLRDFKYQNGKIRTAWMNQEQNFNNWVSGNSKGDEKEMFVQWTSDGTDSNKEFSSGVTDTSTNSGDIKSHINNDYINRNVLGVDSSKLDLYMQLDKNITSTQEAYIVDIQKAIIRIPKSYYRKDLIEYKDFLDSLSSTDVDKYTARWGMPISEYNWSLNSQHNVPVNHTFIYNDINVDRQYGTNGSISTAQIHSSSWLRFNANYAGSLENIFTRDKNWMGWAQIKGAVVIDGSAAKQYYIFIYNTINYPTAHLQWKDGTNFDNQLYTLISFGVSDSEQKTNFLEYSNNTNSDRIYGTYVENGFQNKIGALSAIKLLNNGETAYFLTYADNTKSMVTYSANNALSKNLNKEKLKQSTNEEFVITTKIFNFDDNKMVVIMYTRGNIRIGYNTRSWVENNGTKINVLDSNMIGDDDLFDPSDNTLYQILPTKKINDTYYLGLGNLVTYSAQNSNAQFINVDNYENNFKYDSNVQREGKWNNEITELSKITRINLKETAITETNSSQFDQNAGWGIVDDSIVSQQYWDPVAEKFTFASVFNGETGGTIRGVELMLNNAGYMTFKNQEFEKINGVTTIINYNISPKFANEYLNDRTQDRKDVLNRWLSPQILNQNSLASPFQLYLSDDNNHTAIIPQRDYTVRLEGNAHHNERFLVWYIGYNPTQTLDIIENPDIQNDKIVEIEAKTNE